VSALAECDDPAVSFDIFLEGFANGDPAECDGPAMLAVLEPLISDRRGDWARIVTADGEADVYGLDDPSAGLMVNHLSGVAAWDVLYQLAVEGRVAVMPVGYPPCVADPDYLDQLPEGFEDATVVQSGGEILRLVHEG